MMRRHRLLLQWSLLLHLLLLLLVHNLLQWVQPRCGHCRMGWLVDRNLPQVLKLRRVACLATNWRSDGLEALVCLATNRRSAGLEGMACLASN